MALSSLDGRLITRVRSAASRSRPPRPAVSDGPGRQAPPPRLRNVRLQHQGVATEPSGLVDWIDPRTSSEAGLRGRRETPAAYLFSPTDTTAGTTKKGNGEMFAIELPQELIQLSEPADWWAEASCRDETGELDGAVLLGPDPGHRAGQAHLRHLPGDRALPGGCSRASGAVGRVGWPALPEWEGLVPEAAPRPPPEAPPPEDDIQLTA